MNNEWLYKLIRALFSPMVRVLWIRDVSGLENIPSSGSAILASNHDSNLDSLMLMAVVKRQIFFLAGEKLFKKWWLGPILKATGQIFVDRAGADKSESIRRAQEVLSSGNLFGIYPEGTRSPDGKLQNAKSGAVRLALSSKAPIIPIGMIGTFEILSKHDKFPKFSKCSINIGKPIYLDTYYGDEDSGLARRITDEILMPEIAKLTGEDWPPKN